MKLPHKRNDITGNKHMEPVYPALFDVRIQFPAAVDDSQRELVLDNIVSVGGLNANKLPGTVTQKFKGVTRTFAGAVVDDTSQVVTVTVNVNLDESNSMFTYKMFKQWSDLIYNPMTGERGLAAEYAAGTSMTVTLFNKKEQVFKTYKALDIFINEPIPDLEDLNYETNDPWEPITISFVCDRIDVLDN